MITTCGVPRCWRRNASIAFTPGLVLMLPDMSSVKTRTTS
jgi:hypothetical protein